MCPAIIRYFCESVDPLVANHALKTATMQTSRHTHAQYKNICYVVVCIKILNKLSIYLSKSKTSKTWSCVPSIKQGSTPLYIAELR
jgi:hypothetical protein